MKQLTIRDIARLSGVSTSTVSRAMNGETGINEKTRARILQVIRENHFVPNNSARNLKASETNTLAILINGMENPFFQDCLDLLEEKIRETGYSLTVRAIRSGQDEVEMAARLTNEKKLKGIIFLGGNPEKGRSRMKQIGIPYVRCTGAIMSIQDAGDILVTIDDEMESYRVTRYLLDKGHSRIAIIIADDHDAVSPYRLSGYRRALEEAGIPWNENLVRRMDPGIALYSTENCYITTRRLLESGEDFTALFVTSDAMALGAYKAIYEAGKRIPGDYSVIGFDGIPMGKYYYPSLTTLKQPHHEMVDATVDQLIRAIEGKAHEQQIIFSGSLEERGSVARLE